MSGELDSVPEYTRAFYRLLGVKSGDASLTRRGESADEIAYYHLTRGARAAQRFMLKNGYKDWLKRSASALTFAGTDAANGGQYAALPDDFLKANGDERYSCLVEANGDRWGQQIVEDQREAKGNGFYFRGRQLWLTRNASPPSTLYLDYHYLHPVWAVNVEVEFPMEARSLIVAKAADFAKEESWVPGGDELRASIARAVAAAEREARDVARPTREPRKIRKPRRFGNRW